MIKFILKGSFPLLILTFISFSFLDVDPAVGIFCGLFLSTIFILSSAWVIEQFWEAESSLFVKVFFFSMAIRFLLVIAVMGILLGITKIDEIYFTVSLIISYLYQSVTEMIFINQKLLKKRNKKK